MNPYAIIAPVPLRLLLMVECANYALVLDVDGVTHVLAWPREVFNTN